MRLPTDAAVVEIAFRGFSGHVDYDRGIRDNLADTRRSGDPQGSAYWTFRVLTLAHLHLAGCRYDASCEQVDAAQQQALASMILAGIPAVEYARSALRNRYEQVDR